MIFVPVAPPPDIHDMQVAGFRLARAIARTIQAGCDQERLEASLEAFFKSYEATLRGQVDEDEAAALFSALQESVELHLKGEA